MNLEKAAAALTALAKDAEARSKTAQLRDVLPYVERAIAAGVTHSKILEALKESGLEIQPKAFSSALLRLRAQGATGARRAQPAADPTSIPTRSSALPTPGLTDSPPGGPLPHAPSQGQTKAGAVPRVRPSFDEILARKPNVTELEQRARQRERGER